MGKDLVAFIHSVFSFSGKGYALPTLGDYFKEEVETAIFLGTLFAPICRANHSFRGRSVWGKIHLAVYKVPLL